MMMRTPPLSRMAAGSTASSNPTITVCGMARQHTPSRARNGGQPQQEGEQ
jgi:hypothetical protein